jgi:hypothetical protein
LEFTQLLFAVSAAAGGSVAVDKHGPDAYLAGSILGVSPVEAHGFLNAYRFQNSARTDDIRTSESLSRAGCNLSAGESGRPRRLR